MGLGLVCSACSACFKLLGYLSLTLCYFGARLGLGLGAVYVGVWEETKGYAGLIGVVRTCIACLVIDQICVSVFGSRFSFHGMERKHQQEPEPLARS